MADNYKSGGSGRVGPLRSPIADTLATGSVKLRPSIAENTTNPGTAPKAAPIQSPLTTKITTGKRNLPPR